MPELIITDAGRQAAIDANNNGLTVRMTRVAVGTGQYVPVVTQTTLQTQVAVADIAKGVRIGTDQVQVSARFTAGAWDAYELGVFLDDGTLFAVGSSSSAGDFPTKEAGTDVVVTVTLLISDVPSGSVQVEASIQTTVPPASTTAQGTVELADASDPETDDERAVTPALLKTRTDALVTGLAGAAPAVLDTITKLATALQNNPNVISELLAAIALRARLAGAVFTGRTQGLTRLEGDNGTDFATTEFVMRTNGRQVVLSDNFDLASGVVTRTLTSPLADFRWIELIYGTTEAGYASVRLPSSEIPTVSQSSTDGLVTYINQQTSLTLEAVNTTSGAHTQLGSFTVPTDQGTGGLVIVRGLTHLLSGRSVRSLDLNGNVVSVVASDLGLASNYIRAATVHGNDIFYVMSAVGVGSTVYFYKTDLQFSNHSQVGALTQRLAAIASHGDALYGITTGGEVYSIAPATGVLTSVGNVGITRIWEGLCDYGGVLYAIGQASSGNTSTLITITISSGSLSASSVGESTHINSQHNALVGGEILTLVGSPQKLALKAVEAQASVWQPSGQASQLSLRLETGASLQVLEINGIP